MIDEKKREKWNRHIDVCKKYLEDSSPGDERIYKLHYDCEIAIDNHLRDLEERLREWERSSAEAGTVLVSNDRYNDLLKKEAELAVLKGEE